MDKLLRFWDACTSFASSEVNKKWSDYICSKYTEEGRIYHTITYLINLFDLYQEYEMKLENPQAVALAIFFHKLEYCPCTSGEDHKILDQFKKFMQESGGDQQVPNVESAVCLLLEASTSNLTEAHMLKGSFGTDDVHYFLDFIVAILGSSPQQYNDYATKILAEYSHLPLSSFKQLRIKTLKSLLQIPNVYATKTFQEQREAKARENIQKEIERLSGSD